MKKASVLVLTLALLAVVGAGCMTTTKTENGVTTVTRSVDTQAVAQLNEIFVADAKTALDLAGQYEQAQQALRAARTKADAEASATQLQSVVNAISAAANIIKPGAKAGPTSDMDKADFEMIKQAIRANERGCKHATGA